MDAVIAGYVRTPFAVVRNGPLALMRPDDLAAMAIRHIGGGQGVATIIEAK